MNEGLLWGRITLLFYQFMQHKNLWESLSVSDALFMRVLVGWGAAWAKVILSPCWTLMLFAVRSGSFRIIPNLQGQHASHLTCQMRQHMSENCICKINFREMKDFISWNEGPFRSGRQCTYFMCVAFRTERHQHSLGTRKGPQFVAQERTPTAVRAS